MSQLQEKHPLNPFTNRGVITTPDEFFGREQEIGEIVSRLRAMQSSSVVGERRIGKSSLLYHLAQTGWLRIDDPAYRFFYVTAQPSVSAFAYRQANKFSVNRSHDEPSRNHRHL